MGGHLVISKNLINFIKLLELPYLIHNLHKKKIVVNSYIKKQHAHKSHQLLYLNIKHKGDY